MGLKEELHSGRFIVTADVIPVKGAAIYKELKSIEAAREVVTAVNAADMPGANMRIGSLAVCVKLKDMGIEPILQVTCRDRNRISLQSELLSAYVLGIRNVLCLRGDEATSSDNPGTKPVFDLDAVSLIRAARSLENGFDLGGNRLDGAPRFCIGAALDPGAEDREGEIRKARLKVEAGAEFFQTQPVFDPDAFSGFLEKVSFLGTPVLAGLFVLRSAASARFINKNVPGIHVPDRVIKELEKGDAEQRSIDITIKLARELSRFCPGMHIMMTVPWHHWIPHILNAAGISGGGGLRRDKVAGA